jgi:hypothetical protein
LLSVCIGFLIPSLLIFPFGSFFLLPSFFFILFALFTYGTTFYISCFFLKLNYLFAL